MMVGWEAVTRLFTVTCNGASRCDLGDATLVTEPQAEGRTETERRLRSRAIPGPGASVSG